MKINIIKTFTTSLLVAAIMVPAFAFAAPATDGAPATDSGNTGGGVSIGAPATDNGHTGGGVSAPSAPATDSGNTGGGVSAPAAPATDSGNQGGGTPKPAAPATDSGHTGGGTSNGAPATDSGNTGGGTSGSTVTAPPSGGSSSSSSGSVSSGGSSSYSSGGSSILPLLMNTSQCNYITSYLHIGRANPVDQVVRLQTFLKNTESLNVDATGIFDQKTFDAVSVFQAKYTNDILSPWGLEDSTGYVYYTTRKKINEIYCKATFALTPAQIAEITAYRTSVQNGSIKSPSKNIVINGSNDTTSPTSTIIVKNTNGTSTDNDQTASAGKTSFARNVWNFIKGIFGR